MEGFAHGAAVLLHAGRLGGGDPHRIGQPLRIEPDELAARDPGRDGAERAGQVPAALVVAGRAPAGAHAGFETDRIGQHQIGAADGRTFGRGTLRERKQRGQHRRARMQHHAAHMRIVEIQHMSHLPIGERRVAQTEP